MRIIIFITSFLVLNPLLETGFAHAQNAAFQRWVESFWPEARKKGVSRSTFQRAFKGVTPDPEVIKKAEHQPEFAKPIWEYLASAVSQKRIENGREMLRKHGTLLARIEERYGVDRHIVVAIWGMESSYGQFKGEKRVIRSLATLAYQGSRKKFGRSQLLAALQILERGDIAAGKMTGSWAGAMGHTQFIPTTYNAHAVDFDGDRRRNIWESRADALASTANYLKVSKWRPGETWGYEVKLPKNFNHALTGRKTVKTLAQWSQLGVRRAKGKAFPRPNDRASIVLPAGSKGPAFAVINNFKSILRYNNAIAYGLAVGHLADRIRDPSSGGFSKAWPEEYLPLARSERYQLQKLLAARGFLRGEADGILGSQTRAAVRAYQRANGMAVDGYPSVVVLKHLRRGG
ncbi:MAG: lytic murein transglycosylase [Hyphomicrobiaceae bacterium]|nr:lytic murein transglycosylase [Hyphomicrobiaceae bacterium]